MRVARCCQFAARETGVGRWVRTAYADNIASRSRERARACGGCHGEEASGAVYKIVEVVGVSDKSWEEAGRNAVETAAGSLRDLRVAEVTQMDMKVEDGKVAAFRTRVSLSFKYEA